LVGSNNLVNASGVEQKITVGTFQSRAILRFIDDSQKHATVILVPGAGAHGPEEMMPASITLDGQDHGLFQQFSSALNDALVNTISLGKPGVEFFSGWDDSKWFYDLSVYKSLVWQDLVDNVRAAVDFALLQPGVDPNRIYILGHSEGAAVAVDYAAEDPRIKGIILLGYAGADLATLLDWQLYQREIDFFVATDLDANKDGFIDKTEALRWPEFRWAWQEGQDRVSYAEIKAVIRKNPKLKEIYKALEQSTLYSNGIFRRGEIHTKTASLSQNVFVFNGELDMQTPAREALELGKRCESLLKKNFEITIVPGVGHGFSAPKPPKAQPVLNLTVGPVNPAFQKILTEFAHRNL
jgi:pimeloyl-ACP methyl ester carboxylesterase